MIDVRAEVSCSLGPVISANIADDYLQGSGVIKTRGSVELQGVFVPAVGTTVNFSWNKPGGTTDLPRELRVLSSTVDPFRLVTRVELGCALTYFTNRKPPTENPNSKEENSAVPCYVYNYATLPISASYVLEQCATTLGLTLSSNPLTNKFSVEEFDLSAGYVQAMGDLLVSEGYFGMVRSGTLLEVFSLLDDSMTGPTITADDVIDLGPVGVGTLPGETARVKYTTRRLKVPDPADKNTTLRRMWEREEVIGDATPTSYTYTNDAGDSVTVETLYTPYQITYSTYDKWDRLLRTATREYTVSSEVNGRWSGDAQTFRNCERISYQQNFYKVPAPAGPLDNVNPLTLTPAILDGIYESVVDGDTGTAADCIPAPRPDDYSDVLKSVSETWVSEMELGGSIYIDGFKNDDGTVIGLSGTAGYLSSRAIVTYEKDTASGITKTHTENYAIQALTAPGQQDIATRSSTYTAPTEEAPENFVLNKYLVLRRMAQALRFVKGETRIRTEREFGLQKRPSQSDRNNTGNAKNEPVEATEETVWAVGSVETEATQEFSLPYAPDDAISWTELGGYTSTPSDAKEKALAYGRIQNRLLLGNRYALSLQLDPGMVPDAPFKPLYVQAAGITGQYRVNGCSWVMTKDGVIASTDALYWGAVGADPGATSWVPLPPGMDAGDLPATPVTPSVVIPPFNETVVRPLTVRAAMEVQKFGYALEVLTEADPLGIVLGIGVTRVVIGTAGNYAITGNPATTRRNFTAVAAAGSYAVSGVAASLNAPKKLTASTGTFSVVGRPTLLDSDASTYITAVETADGLALEEGVRTSIDIFVRGCKADSIWAAIKASCILSGARTLSGALTPLVGSAPSNVNFVSGDYNRKTGLLGDGSSKYLNSNRANNADPQDNRHMGVYLTAGVSGGSVRALLGAESAATSGTSLIYNESTASNEMRFTLSSNTTPSPSGAGASSGTATGYVGASRSVSGSFSGRVSGSTATYTSTSQAPSSGNIAVFARTTSSPARYCDCRIAFYSIGESLDLSKLEARITTLANAFSTAIP